MGRVLDGNEACRRHVEDLVQPGSCRDRILDLIRWMFSIPGNKVIPYPLRCYVTADSADIRFYLSEQGKDHFALFKLKKRCAVLQVYGDPAESYGRASHLAPVPGNRVWFQVKRTHLETLPMEELKRDILQALDVRLRQLQSSAAKISRKGTTAKAGQQPNYTRAHDVDTTASPRPAPHGQDTVVSGSDVSLRTLFDAAEKLIARECERNPSADLQSQYRIIASREWPRLNSESDILNCLVIQAASYSVVRRYFGILYPEDIWKLDEAYGTRFFRKDLRPELDYEAWKEAVLAWGGGLLGMNGLRRFDGLEALVATLRQAHEKGDRELGPRKPRSRLVLSLATALPKVNRIVLSDTNTFLDRLDAMSHQNPRAAYDYATDFSEGIIGMGNALVTNFFKELGLLYYVKVDVHLGDLMDELTVGHDLSAREQFMLSWLVAREAGMGPFFLDKILYVGGKYLKTQMRDLFSSHRAAYEGAVARLLEELKGL